MASRSPSRTPSSRTIDLLIGFLCLVWGSTWAVIKEGLNDLPPLSSAAARFVLAAVVMALVAHFMRNREGGKRPSLWLTLVMGVCNFSLSYGLVYWSETHLPSGLVSVLWGVYPLFLAGVSYFLLPTERLSLGGVLGLVLGLLGLIFLLAVDLQALGKGASGVGLLLLVSPLVSAFGTAIVKRDGAGVSSVLLNRDGLFLGAGLLVIAALIAESPQASQWTPRAMGTIAYLAIVGTVATFATYFWLLRHTTAARLSLIAYIAPVVAVTLGVIVHGEQLRTSMIVGGVMILLGVMLTTQAQRKAQGLSK